MAQLMTVRLSRGDAQPWGLRLQGGKDFGTPLVVQKVSDSWFVCAAISDSYRNFQRHLTSGVDGDECFCL